MFKVYVSEFFKVWTCGDMRVMKDKADHSFYSYKVQKYNGKTWDDVSSHHTLKEAKREINC